MKFFPNGKIVKVKNDNATFTMRYYETLYEAWERYKDLQRHYPYHSLLDWLLIQKFYN